MYKTYLSARWENTKANTWQSLTHPIVGIGVQLAGLAGAWVSSYIFGGPDFAWGELQSWFLFGLAWLIAANGAFVVFNWFASPYRLDSIKARKISTLQTEVTEFKSLPSPSLFVSDPIESTFPKGKTGHAKRFYCINIKNTSKLRLVGCRVKEAALINNRGHAATDGGRYFQISSERHSIQGQHDYEQSFDLQGLGDDQNIDIVWMDEVKEPDSIYFQYATKSTVKTYYKLPRGLFPHRLTVRVTAENLPVPHEKTFVIRVSNDGFLKMETAET